MKRWIAAAAAVLLVLLSAVNGLALDARFVMSETTRQTLNGEKLKPQKTGCTGLDKSIKQIIDQCVSEDMDAASQLQACFDFIVKYMNNEKETPNIDYRPGRGDDTFSAGPEEAWAERALYSGFRGTCPEYASLFVLLARRIGYQSRIVVGETPSAGGGLTEHKWAEVTIGDETYIFDPYLEQNFIQKGIATPGTFFCTTYEKQPSRFVNGHSAVRREIRSGNSTIIIIE